MKRYKLIIAYDGTLYSGWQVQPNAPSIQEKIEEALAILLKEKRRIIGAGRTDSGVHAHGQAAHFDCDQDIDCKRFIYQLNGLLPSDIRIKAIAPVSSDFHAQISASSKVYHYHLWLGRAADPFLSKYRWHIFEEISPVLLQEAALNFVGKKDFAAFTNTGGSVKTTVRTIHRIDVVEQEGGLRLEFEGDGFLYKMVRNITGTIFEVVRGKRSIESLQGLLEGRDRREAGLAAPAKGLFLMEVKYSPFQVMENEKILLSPVFPSLFFQNRE